MQSHNDSCWLRFLSSGAPKTLVTTISRKIRLKGHVILYSEDVIINLFSVHRCKLFYLCFELCITSVDLNI